MNTQKLKSLSLLTLLLVALVTLFFVSCEKSGISEEEYQTQYRREAQLINVYELFKIICKKRYKGKSIP